MDAIFKSSHETEVHWAVSLLVCSLEKEHQAKAKRQVEAEAEGVDAKSLLPTLKLPPLQQMCLVQERWHAAAEELTTTMTTAMLWHATSTATALGAEMTRTTRQTAAEMTKPTTTAKKEMSWHAATEELTSTTTTTNPASSTKEEAAAPNTPWHV